MSGFEPTMLARQGAPVQAARLDITPANRQAFEEGIKKLPDFSNYKAGPASATGSMGGQTAATGMLGPHGAGTVAAAPQALQGKQHTPTTRGVAPRARTMVGVQPFGAQPMAG